MSRPRPRNGRRWSRRRTSGGVIPPAAPRVLHSRPRALSAGMILYPAIDLKDGQCVRLLRGRHATRRPCSATTPPRRRAPSRRPARRWLHLVDLDGAFAGRPVNARGGRGDPRRRRPCRCSSAAASATAPTIEALAREGRRPGRPRHRGGARPGAGARRRPRPSRPHRGRHRRARRPGGGRGLGRDHRDSTRSSSPAASRTPASPPSSTPTSTATARSPARTSRPPPRSPGRWRIPVIACGGIAVARRPARAEGERRAARRGDRRPRALRGRGSTSPRPLALPARA